LISQVGRIFAKLLSMKMQTPTILITLLCLAAIGPKAQAVSPPPDGGYSGGNTAEGQNALLGLTTGTYNTAIGFLSLRNDMDGQFNTAAGAGTLLANRADQNSATGAGALLSNTTGGSNTATGTFALFFNTTGDGNIAVGASAGINLTTGNNNIDIGNAVWLASLVRSGSVTRQFTVRPTWPESMD
jgi:hypothetical protein